MTDRAYFLFNLHGLRFRIHRRSTMVFVVLAVILMGFIALALTMGVVEISIIQAFNALFFNDGEPGHLLLVNQLRFPRIIAAVLAGACLAGSGLLMQCLSNNRLANPEFLGINDGAALSMILIVILSGGARQGAWWLPGIGAFSAGALLLLVAGGVGTRGYRVLLVGIGIGGTIKAVGELLLSRLDLQHSSIIYNWSMGSTVGQGYEVSVPVACGMAVVLPICLLIGRSLALMQFDENVSRNLGLNHIITRLVVYTLSVVLAALAVGMAGPISFVALAAPIITASLVGPARVPVLTSSMTGATLVLGADTIGKIAGYPGEVPVGVVTTLLGGPFLLWILLRSPR